MCFSYNLSLFYSFFSFLLIHLSEFLHLFHHFYVLNISKIISCQKSVFISNIWYFCLIIHYFALLINSIIQFVSVSFFYFYFLYSLSSFFFSVCRLVLSFDFSCLSFSFRFLFSFPSFYCSSVYRLNLF